MGNYYKRDLLGLAYKKDFNRPDAQKLSKRLLGDIDMGQCQLVLVNPSAGLIERSSGLLMYVDDHTPPVVVIHDRMLSDPVLYAGIVVHELVHYEQYASGRLTWSNGGSGMYFDGVHCDPTLTKGRDGHLLAHEVPAYAAQLYYMQSYYPELTLDALLR